MNTLDLLTGALVTIGAVNWGLVAATDRDLVATIAGHEFGETNAVSRTVYGLVGISALYHAASMVRRARAGAVDD